MTKNHNWRENHQTGQRIHHNLRGERAALVSVIIPCYNQAHFLGEAIASVLAQSYPHFEVVVVDDGSTDHTPEVATRYSGVRYVRQSNQGLSAARNAGLRQSQGGYVVFLDADDRLLPGALEVGVQCLEAHLGCLFVSGRYRIIASDGSISRNQPPPLTIGTDPYAALLQGNYIGMHATVMYRRAAFEFVGGFDPSLRACEDYDLYLRVAKHFPTYHHGVTVAEYRHHGENMTRNSALMLRSALTVLRTQRKSAKGNQHYEQACKSGVEYWHKWYGDALVAQIKGHLRQCEWGIAVRNLLTLMRYYPRGLIRLLPASLRHWLRALPHKGGHREMVDHRRLSGRWWVQEAQTRLRRPRKNAGLSDTRKRIN